MITLLLQLLALLYVFALPGLLVALQLDADWSLPVRGAVGFCLALLTIPMLCFCVAWILATSITPAVAVGVASVVNAVAGGLWVWRRRSAAPTLLTPPHVLPCARSTPLSRGPLGTGNPSPRTGDPCRVPDRSRP